MLFLVYTIFLSLWELFLHGSVGVSVSIGLRLWYIAQRTLVDSRERVFHSHWHCLLSGTEQGSYIFLIKVSSREQGSLVVSINYLGCIRDCS